ILGEWRGNVRSTPTPKECLQTVNVSRAPAPCRLITIPSNAWIRWRLPSITLKWTRTVSPALKRGTSRSSPRSRSWMTVLVVEGAGGSGAEAPWRPAHPSRDLQDRDPARGPVDRDHLPDQVGARHRPPHAGVAGAAAVVAHHEVLARRHVPGLVLVRVGGAAVRLDVRLVQLLPVDPDEAARVLVDRLARHPDQPLDEDAAL